MLTFQKLAKNFTKILREPALEIGSIREKENQDKISSKNKIIEKRRFMKIQTKGKIEAAELTTPK